MPFSSNTFLQFKWWRSPGLDAAVWFCHHGIADTDLIFNLSRAIQSLDDRQVTNWIISMLNIGQPSVLSRIISGIKNIWVTGQSVTSTQKEGRFPKYFNNFRNLKTAGIITNRVDGFDRPDRVPSDYCLDIIVTFVTNDSLSPICQRERIPQWTSTQQSTIGRYTTGPLSTVWSKV